jgi:putative cell wall-binding protein
MSAHRSTPRHAVALLACLALIVGLVGFSGVSQAQTTGDRYGTAALLATEAYPAGADVVLVASGENFPDALAAAPLAAFYDAPIVLTQRDSLPAVTAAALAELDPGDVIVLGGTAAVGQAVFNELVGGPWQATRYAG